MASLSKFTNPEVFRRFSPVLLAEFLGRSTEAVKARGVDLPLESIEDNLPYDRIARLFLSADEALMELYDAINLVNTLAANKGRGAILEVAKEKNVWVPRELSFPYDVALWTWLHYPDIAERAGYRLKMHNARSFYYFPSFLGDDTPELQYTPENIERFAASMGSFYAQASKGGVAKVLDVMEKGELWLLIRHGGYLERRGDVDEESGEVSTICFRDEEYDVLIYNTRHRELKIRRTTDATMERLKAEFGQIFFGSAHTFVGRESFPLSVLKQNDLSFFRTVKVPGIKKVNFSEVRYMLPGPVTKTVHEKSDDLLQSGFFDGAVVPATAFHVDFAKLHFHFDGEDKYRSVALYPPNRSSFARESDAPKVEEWLREATLLQGGCKSDPDERFFKALNIHLGQSYTLNEWHLFFGDTFDRAEPFLQDTGQVADYWCAFGSAKRFAILREGKTVTALSPDYENSPGRIAPGSVCDALAESVDIYPTLVDVAGGKMPKEIPFDGESLLPWMKGTVPDEWRKIGFSDVKGVFGLFTHDWFMQDQGEQKQRFFARPTPPTPTQKPIDPERVPLDVRKKMMAEARRCRAIFEQTRAEVKSGQDGSYKKRFDAIGSGN